MERDTNICLKFISESLDQRLNKLVISYQKAKNQDRGIYQLGLRNWGMGIRAWDLVRSINIVQ